MSSRRVRMRDGVELHVAESGAAGDPPLILLHGFPELGYSWRHQVPALTEAGFHVIVPDLRGFGRSDAPAQVEAYAVDALAADVLSLLDAARAERGVVIGHDWGADVAWKTAWMHPERIAAVAGLSVPFIPRAPAPPLELMRRGLGEDFYIVWFQEPGVADEALSRDVRRTLASTRVWTDSWAREEEEEPPTPRFMTDDELAVYVEAFERTGFTGGLSYYRNIDRNWELTEPFDQLRIEQPALFLTGERDPVRRFAPAEAMNGWVLDLRASVVVPGAGHWVNQEAPEAVNDALLQWLGGLSLLVRAAAEAHVGDTDVPGLVALAARGDEVHVEALGSLTIGGSPVTRDSIFRIASTTKPITAAATLAVIDEGLIGLDEPVDRLLPELGRRRVLRRMDAPLDDTVPARRPITTRDLLTFTFGFGLVPEIFTAPTPWPVVAAEQALRLSSIGGPPDPAIQPEPGTWIANLGTLPLMAQPGERWLYNTGASVLGVLLARATGQPVADVLRTRVFEPLGMIDTAFWTSATDRLATAYRPTREGLVVWDEPDGTWSRPPAFCDGAAGLVSTADDLLAFARMLRGGGAPVLTAAAVRAMTTDQLTDAQKSHGGLLPGFFDGRSWGFCQAVLDGGAYGWDGGFGSSWLVDPANDLVVIVLTQRMFESPALPQAHRDIRAAAYAALA